VKQVQPRYTDAALRAKISGDVLIEAVVSTTGAVSDARVIKSLDQTYGLDDAALAAAKQWRFEPGRRDGTPIPVIVTMLLEFRNGTPLPDRLTRAMYARGSTRLVTLREFQLGVELPGTPGLVPPKVMKAVEAKYTSEAMREKTEGDVKVDVVVQPDGTVSRAMVMDSLRPDLDLNALDSALDWKFQAGSLNGQPVAALVHLVIAFRLH
jgi:TonB family protein